MAKLEEITVGSHVDGIANGETVQVIAVKWYGTGVLEVTFKNPAGLLGSQLLYRENESEIEIKGNNLPWSFDADGGWYQGLIASIWRISSTRIWLYIHLPSSRSHIRYLPYTKRCFPVYHCAMCLLMTPVPARRL